MSILTDDKITGIVCIVDDFCKELSKELTEIPKLEDDGKKHRNRPCTMSESEIITILLLLSFRKFQKLQTLLPALYLCPFETRISKCIVIQSFYSNRTSSFHACDVFSEYSLFRKMYRYNFY